MLLSELNLKALNVSAESVLPLTVSASIEDIEVKFNITAYQTAYGSGKKTVISGSIHRADNDTTKLIENADIEKVRRVVSSLCELTTSGRTSGRKPRTPKEQPVIEKTEVEKLRDSLAVARRLPKEWVKIDTAAVWKAYQEAKKRDAAPNKLLQLTQLDAEKQLKAYELLKKAGLL